MAGRRWLMHTHRMDATLAAQLAERKAERGRDPPLLQAVAALSSAPRQPKPLPQDTPDDPAVPWVPLARGELAAILGAQPGVAQPVPEPDVVLPPEVACLPVRGRALWLLEQSLPTLGRIAADTHANASDRIAAIREMGKIADVYTSAQASVVVRLDLLADRLRAVVAVGRANVLIDNGKPYAETVYGPDAPADST